ncbi:ShlB/FhaC/HecB family hemolysin secretion/activation protein [Verrucomicrobium sp. GAS474]|uniref:ShlB/FhaC/HecB family hemolysin secretion/activation protein n=1 Tax=Verrucomicrobium sp. GAS474 TaxID=1882831 RepID=UPI0012FF6A95|nr:ShlB/FhaC/HecB family hemolysin secretion/activation protein [Verrucomicrobium sp. GAS474]
MQNAVAQDFEHLHPKQLPQTNLPPPPANAPVPVTEGDDTEIAPALKGIVLLTDSASVKADGISDASAFNGSSVNLPLTPSLAAPAPAAKKKSPRGTGDASTQGSKGKKSLAASPAEAAAAIATPETSSSTGEGTIYFNGNFSEADKKGLVDSLQGYLGQPVSMQKLNELLRDIILYYRRGDRPLIDPYLPEQDMKGDVVQIVIRQAKRGKVLTEGNKYFPNDLLISYIRTPEGAPLRSDSINSDVAWLNRNPFLQSTLVYQAGEEPGTTDIVLKTQDRMPFRVYTGYEDTGSTLTGDGRLEAGFNWGNAFGIGDQFNYQYTTSDDFHLVRAHSATYTHFLPWHHVINVVGTYADSKASFPAYLPYQSSGDAWQVGFRYTVPLPDLKPFGQIYTHEFVSGYDFKESSSQLLVNSTFIPQNSPTTQVSEFSAGYNFSIGDAGGVTSLSNSVFYSPGGLLNHDKAPDYLAANASGSKFVYYRLSFSRTQKLPKDFSFIFKGSYQATNERLLGGEQMGLGGYDTVRGYEMREANGDEGYFFSGEVRTPGWSIGRFFVKDYDADRFTLLGFTDYGGVSQYRPDSTQLRSTPSTNPNVNLWSAGAGFRYNINPYFSVRFDYGWQLIDSGVDYAFRHHDGSRGHLGLTFSY